MVNSIFAALFPSYCRLCGLPGSTEMPLCNVCRGCLAPNMVRCSRCAIPMSASLAPEQQRYCGHCLNKPPPYNRVIAPWIYEEHMAFLTHCWKFQGERRLSAMLAMLWLEKLEEPPQMDLIVPVPLHWWRLARRGYNQSELLAYQLCQLCPALSASKLNSRLVSRCRATRSQSNLSANSRRKNLVGAFKVNQPCDNLRIAIVDDVMTTGSTATELANCLSDAGASAIEIWCLARTPAPPN